MQQDFFSDGSPYLHHPLLTAERTAMEADFLVAQLGLRPGARVLDVGCGFGRHSIELARRGYRLLGIDSSAAMIAAARKRAIEAGVSVEFKRISAVAFSTRNPFDVAICLFTTLGQISEQGDNSRLLEKMLHAIRPSGHFMVEVPQREVAVRQLRESEQFDHGQHFTRVTRSFDASENIVTEIFSLVAPEGERTYRLQYRLFNRAELVDRMTQTGFEVSAIYGDYRGSSLSEDSPIMIAVGSKPFVRSCVQGSNFLTRESRLQSMDQQFLE